MIAICELKEFIVVLESVAMLSLTATGEPPVHFKFNTAAASFD